MPHKIDLYAIIFCLGFFLLTGCNSTPGDKQEDTAVCGNVSQNNSEKVWNQRNLSIKGDVNNGKELFKKNCSMCHTITDKKLTAPGLAGILDRTPHPAEEYLIKLISNNAELIRSGDPYANKIFAENGTLMPRFDATLTEQEVKDIVIYITGF